MYIRRWRGKIIVLKGVENLSFGKRIDLMREAEKRLSKTNEYKKIGISGGIKVKYGRKLLFSRGDNEIRRE